MGQGIHKKEIWLPERSSAFGCAVEGSDVALMCALRLRKRAPLSALKHVLLNWSSYFVKALDLHSRAEKNRYKHRKSWVEWVEHETSELANKARQPGGLVWI